MAVPMKTGSTVEPGTPQPLFPVPAIPLPANWSFYAPSRDCQRFLVNAPTGGESAAAVAQPVTVVLNWQAAIKKK
jgi:hypothetical protein